MDIKLVSPLSAPIQPWQSEERIYHGSWIPQAGAESCYQVQFDSGRWSWTDDVGEDLIIEFRVPENAHVQLVVTRGASLNFNRTMKIILGNNASLVVDVIDLSSLAQDHWKLEAGSHSVFRLNHAIENSTSRYQTIRSKAGSASRLACNFAIRLEGSSQYHQQAWFTLDADDSQIEHRMHGVASESAKGTFESFVHMPKGAKRVSSMQSMKTFALSRAQWHMQPDLIIDHQDVMASHGACQGSIDANSLLYAASRGIREDVFRKLYYRGFLLSALQQPAQAIEDVFGMFHESIFPRI